MFFEDSQIGIIPIIDHIITIYKLIFFLFKIFFFKYLYLMQTLAQSSVGGIAPTSLPLRAPLAITKCSGVLINATYLKMFGKIQFFFKCIFWVNNNGKQKYNVAIRIYCIGLWKSHMNCPS